jgi:long-subunit fatty acid transport protein
VPYFDSYYDLGYNRKLDANLTLDLGARLATADYNSGSLEPSNHRDDWMYTINAGLGYAVNANLSLTGSYSMDLGRNEQDSIANGQTRNFDHYVVSLGAKYNF